MIAYYSSYNEDWQRSSLNENAFFRNITIDGENETPQIRLATNPMCRTFPRVAACDYHRFGPGGRPASMNTLCVLALNIINDKVFVLIWWWLVFLAIAGTMCRLRNVTAVVNFIPGFIYPKFNVAIYFQAWGSWHFKVYKLFHD